VKEFFLDFVRLHILYHADGEYVYGAWLLKELGRHGYNLSPGTLYPILHNLERKGLLRSRRLVVDGRRRRCYILTKEGKLFLESAREKIKELIGEILVGETP